MEDARTGRQFERRVTGLGRVGGCEFSSCKQ